MSTLAEIEAAAAKLPHDQQRNLREWLAAHIGNPDSTTVSQHSVMEIAPVSLGGIIDSGAADDDVLGEMLEGRV